MPLTVVGMLAAAFAEAQGLRTQSLGHDNSMTDPERAALERLARCFAHPILIGPEADLAVSAVVAWEHVNADADTARRERAWAKIIQLA